MLITKLFCFHYLLDPNKIIIDMIASQNYVNKTCWKSFLFEKENVVLFFIGIIPVLER